MARILHIESDAETRTLVEKLLLEQGHEVIHANNGLSGIRKASSVSPHLILVDVQLPDLDGYEVTLRLRGIPELRGVPVVVTMAEADYQTSLAVGADGFIQKPINPELFVRDIDQYLRGRREFADATGEFRLRERSQKIVERLENKIIELEQVNGSLEEMARLRREFLQNVTHELATPMTPVVGYLRLLLNEELGPLTPLQKKCLHSIEVSTDRLRSLIDTLLDVSSLETERMHFYERAYDFREIANKAVTEAQPRFEEAGVLLVKDIPSIPMEARGDPDKLRRAMTHILDNAVKFTPPGGNVVVAVEAEEKPESPGQRWYRISVADSGPGMAPSERARVFEPFYQADGSPTRSYGGVGLGLAFARRVSEALGGGIHIESPPTRPIAGSMLTGTMVALSVNKEPRHTSGHPTHHN